MMPLKLLPIVTVTPLSATDEGDYLTQQRWPLQIRAAIRPVHPDVLACYRLEPENRPPLPGLVLVALEDAIQLAKLECVYFRLDAEELGALDGHIFISRGFQMDPFWAVWDLQAKLEITPGAKQEYAPSRPAYHSLVVSA